MRRVFSPQLHAGQMDLATVEAHHVRDVLRCAVGDGLELFDAAGQTARATITAIGPEGVRVQVDAVHDSPTRRLALTVASAVPKADRADWLVEKLSELGVARWIPLQTARSVVHPVGQSKFDRWRRIAIEAAKQSRRSGVMEIDPLTALNSLDLAGQTACILSTRPTSRPWSALSWPVASRLLLVGPEGGWTEEELAWMIDRGAMEASLTATVLRVETAAILAAGVTLLDAERDRP